MSGVPSKFHGLPQKIHYSNFTFSADGLKEVLVNNYDEINARMEEGTVIQNSKEIRHSICEMFCTNVN